MWEDDYPERVLLAAKAMKALYRPRKALELFRVAQAQGEEGARKSIMELEQLLEA